LKRGCLIAAAVGGALLILAVAAVDFRYGLLRSSPRINHTDYAPARSSFRLAIDPEPALPVLLPKLAAQNPPLPVPTPLLRYVMPYEIAFMADPDPSLLQSETVLFVNDRRLGPVLAQHSAQLGITQRFPRIQWETPGLQRERRGVLMQTGAEPLSQRNLALLEEYWGTVSPLSSLELEGGHFMEAVMDLRDGRGFLLLADWLGRGVPPDSLTHPTQLVHFVKNVATIRIFLNLPSESDLAVQFRIECRPEATDSDVNSLRFLLNSSFAQLQQALDAYYGISIEGAIEVEGLRILGAYRLSPVDRVLAAMGFRF